MVKKYLRCVQGGAGLYMYMYMLIVRKICSCGTFIVRPGVRAKIDCKLDALVSLFTNPKIVRVLIKWEYKSGQLGLEKG